MTIEYPLFYGWIRFTADTLFLIISGLFLWEMHLRVMDK
jgi:hypothetical protein